METCEVSQSVIEVREWFDDHTTRSVLDSHGPSEYWRLGKNHFRWYNRDHKNLRANIDTWRKLDAPKEGSASGLRQGGHDDGQLAWVGAHWRELVEQYPNRWVLIADQKVAADAATPSELAKEAGRLGIKRPFMTKIGQGPVVWRTAYAR
jgi:hypothetical protein